MEVVKQIDRWADWRDLLEELTRRVIERGAGCRNDRELATLMVSVNRELGYAWHGDRLKCYDSARDCIGFRKVKEMELFPYFRRMRRALRIEPGGDGGLYGLFLYPPVAKGEQVQRYEPFLDREPRATAERQLAKMVSSSNWSHRKAGCKMKTAKRALRSAICAPVTFLGIDLRNSNGEYYIRAYCPERDAIGFERLTFEDLKPYVVKIIHQISLEDLITEDKDISIVLSRVFRKLPGIAQ